MVLNNTLLKDLISCEFPRYDLIKFVDLALRAGRETATPRRGVKIKTFFIKNPGDYRQSVSRLTFNFLCNFHLTYIIKYIDYAVSHCLKVEVIWVGGVEGKGRSLRGGKGETEVRAALPWRLSINPTCSGTDVGRLIVLQTHD